MYCPECGEKILKDQKFCMNCGKKLSSKKSNSTSKSLFQKISLESLSLMNAQNDEWRRNTEILPDDCWALFMQVSGGQAASFLDKNGYEANQEFIDLLQKLYFTSHSYGLWIWIAEQKYTNPNALKKVVFDYADTLKDSTKFMIKWDGFLDGIDTDIPEDTRPSFAIAQKKMELGVDTDDDLSEVFDDSEILQLKSDFLGAIYRGYFLYKFFN